MAPVIVDPAAIRAFPDAPSFEAWLSQHHADARELYLRIYKKGSGVPTITYAEALDVALCWGWIDGLKKSYDELSFLQRFSPRQGTSVWSKINVGHIERLTAAGRMQPSGQAHVEKAKADGRWDAAYASASTMAMPLDLLAAIEANPAAAATFASLNGTNRYALAFRLNNLKTPAGRTRKIESFVAMLAEGRTIYPNPPPRTKAGDKA